MGREGASLDTLVALDEEIERLEVAMDEVSVVDGSEAVERVEQVAQPQRPRHPLRVLLVGLAPLAVDDLEEGAALHELHDDSGRRVEHAVAAHDAGVVHGRHLAHLDFELGERLVVHRRPIRLVLLNGDGVLLVFALEDVADRAAPDLAADGHLRFVDTRRRVVQPRHCRLREESSPRFLGCSHVCIDIGALRRIRTLRPVADGSRPMGTRRCRRCFCALPRAADERLHAFQYEVAVAEAADPNFLQMCVCHLGQDLLRDARLN